MTDPVFLKIDLPPDTSEEDQSALRSYLETNLTQDEGLTAEVDVEDPSRGIGGIDPALIITLIATGAGVAANLGTIVKNIKEAKSLFAAEKKDKKSELTPVQKLLLSIDPEKIVVRTGGADVPVMDLVAEAKS